MLIVIIFLVLLLYLFLIVTYTIGWYRLDRVEPLVFANNLTISVVVCARNEEACIGYLLQCIVNQSFRPLEIIVVDDGSTDRMADVISHFPSVQLIHTTGIGKKQGLQIGVQRARGELIVCTDADCSMGDGWLHAIASCYVQYHPSMIIAPVQLHYDQSFWQQLQALEFMSLAASTAGAAGVGHSVMCNGANLAFTKVAWNKSCCELKLEEPSGDDMFLMISLKRRKEHIQYLKSREALVFTQPCLSVGDFVRQRSRWVSKSRSYTDKEVLITAGLVLSISVLPLLLGIVSLFIHGVWILALSVWATKTIIDALFLSMVSPFFSALQLLRLIMLLAVIYPFYLIGITLAGLLGHVKWKERVYPCRHFRNHI
jgi:cellulose synthase/poly-beta-1,6-N-acetylglucosamine synthase-like glycosyltransferase